MTSDSISYEISVCLNSYKIKSLYINKKRLTCENHSRKCKYFIEIRKAKIPVFMLDDLIFLLLQILNNNAGKVK